MRNAINKKIGVLKTLTIEGATGGPCVILFHGYGADASDLLPLAQMMNLSKEVTWVFPEAPLEIIIAPGFSGKAWYPIDNKRLEESMRSGVPVDLSQTTPPGLEQARKAATSLYDELTKQHSHVVVGGFSQGAILTTELSLSHEKKPAGLVLMSGTLINKDRWAKLAPARDGLRFIQSHGKNDALLGYEYAENLYNLLSDAGLYGEFVAFSGGHEIPPKVIEKISKFISMVIKK